MTGRAERAQARPIWLCGASWHEEIPQDFEPRLNKLALTLPR
jgi:hypothetical protein